MLHSSSLRLCSLGWVQGLQVKDLVVLRPINIDMLCICYTVRSSVVNVSDSIRMWVAVQACREDTRVEPARRSGPVNQGSCSSGRQHILVNNKNNNSSNNNSNSTNNNNCNKHK